MRIHPLRATNKSTTFGAIGLLALASVVVAMGSGHRSNSVDMLSGNAWLVNNKKGQIVRVNAATGQPDAGVQVGKPGGKYQVEQDGDFVIVRDANGVVRRIDTRNLIAGPGQSYGRRFNVVIGGGAAYAVDASTGVVRRLDPNTLAPLGQPIHLGGALSDEVVDGGGQLWAMVSGKGRVVEVGGRGIEGSHAYGPPGDRGFLSLVGTEVVVIDTTGSTIGTVGSGDVHMANLGTSGPVLAPKKTETGPLWLLASASGELVRYSPGHAPTTLALSGAARGDDLGAPELVGTNLYLPDFTYGSLVRINTTTGSVAQTIPFLHHRGSFDVFVSGGSLWANNDDGSIAIVVNQNGSSHDVSKYRTDVPGLEQPALPPSLAPSDQSPPPDTAPPLDTAPPAGSFLTPPWSPTSPSPAPPSSPQPPSPAPPSPTPPPWSGPQPPSPAPPSPTPPPEAQPPSAPTVTATPGDRRVVATWTVPATNGSTITAYDVTISPKPKAASDTKSIGSDQTSATFTGLTDGTAYSVTVIAQSTAGPSQPGQSAPVTPTRTAPPMPQIRRVTPGVGSITVGWTGNKLGGSDKVTAQPAQLPAGCQLDTPCGTPPTRAAAAKIDPATSPAKLTGLVSGRVYGVRVTAKGRTGGTTASETIYERIPTTPGAPGVTVSVTNIRTGSTTGSVTVTIKPPANHGGMPITGYTVTGLGARRITSGGIHTFTVNKGRGTYQVNVSAANQVGSGPQTTRTPQVSYASNFEILVDNGGPGFQWIGPTHGSKYAPDGNGNKDAERLTESGGGAVGGTYFTTINDLIGCRTAGSPGQRTTAVWTANLPAGNWKVQVFIPQGQGSKTAAQEEHGPGWGPVDYFLNGQKIIKHQDGGQWVTIGTSSGSRTSTLKMTDRMENGSTGAWLNCDQAASHNVTAVYMSADAARWIPS